MSGIEACYIRLHRERVRKQQRDLVSQMVAKSRYPVMDRNERRTFEYYADEISQLRAQTKDLKKANVVATRIGVVLERMRKELNKIKQHLTDYNFASTTGNDQVDESDGTGATYSPTETVCDASGDLSMDSSTRHAWVEQAKTMIICLRNFSLAQRLGNYTLLWDPDNVGLQSVLQGGNTASSHQSGACASGTPATLVYRKEFLYMQFSTECRTITSAATAEVDPAEIGNDADPGCPKNNHNYFSISNPDIDVHALFEELVCGVADDDNSTTDDTVAVTLEAVDDERDVMCILQRVQKTLEDVMTAQQDNDNEQAALECAKDVNGQNLCWFEGQAAEMSEIDEDEIKQKHSIGGNILNDLSDLYRTAASSKDYFSPSELTSTGASFF